MSLVTPLKLRRLQEAVHQAKQEPAHRFHRLYDKVYRADKRWLKAPVAEPAADGGWRYSGGK